MCDCFPASSERFPVSLECQAKIGKSEYDDSFRKWHSSILVPTKPVREDDRLVPTGDSNFQPRYTFSKGPRFGVAPYCDCTPPSERNRFESTYMHDYVENLHKKILVNGALTQPFIPGVKPKRDFRVPKQYLCPFTTETTYSRAFDMTQPHVNELCFGSGDNEATCQTNDCCTPGVEIQFSQGPKQKCVRRLRKEELIKPGTDTSECCECPVILPCCPCPSDSTMCDEACCEYPCKLHMATTTPTRRYPFLPNVPRYVPNPRDPPKRPLLLCRGGTRECPLQNEFPTKAAMISAKERLKEKLEKERCRFPPECVESLYRSTFRKLPDHDTPTYCSADTKREVCKAEQRFAERGALDCCLPDYCLDGGHPPDPRPMFDHMSTHQVDYTWKNPHPYKFKYLGGELCTNFDLQPVCYPGVVHSSEIIKEHTEESERWGQNWECCPEP